MDCGSKRGVGVLVATLCACSAISMLAVFFTVQKPVVSPFLLNMHLQEEQEQRVVAAIDERLLHRSTLPQLDSASSGKSVIKTAAKQKRQPEAVRLQLHKPIKYASLSWSAPVLRSERDHSHGRKWYRVDRLQAHQLQRAAAFSCNPIARNIAAYCIPVQFKSCSRT